MDKNWLERYPNIINYGKLYKHVCYYVHGHKLHAVSKLAFALLTTAKQNIPKIVILFIISNNYLETIMFQSLVSR